MFSVSQKYVHLCMCVCAQLLYVKRAICNLQYVRQKCECLYNIWNVVSVVWKIDLNSLFFSWQIFAGPYPFFLDCNKNPMEWHTFLCWCCKIIRNMFEVVSGGVGSQAEHKVLHTINALPLEFWYMQSKFFYGCFVQKFWPIQSFFGDFCWSICLFPNLTILNNRMKERKKRAGIIFMGLILWCHLWCFTDILIQSVIAAHGI